MTKQPLTYRVDERARTLRVALINLEKGNTKPFVRYLNDGGTIIDERDRQALAYALTPKKKTPGKPSDTSEASEAADNILWLESRWRKANPGNRLPNAYRVRLIKRIARAAWLEDGQWQSTYKKMKHLDDKRIFRDEYENAVEAELLKVLENKRKNKSRKPRTKK
jgi:hypothetical protein